MAAMTAPHIARLRGIRDIASLINAGSDLATILDRIVFAVCQHTSWSIAGIMKVNLESGYSELVSRFDPRHDPKSKLPTRWNLATSPSLRVAETKSPLIIEDAQRSAAFPDYRKDAVARGYHTVVVLPLGATDTEGREMVLSVQSREALRVSEDELAFLTTIAHLGAIAVEKAKRLEAGRASAERLERTLEINASLLERALAEGAMPTLIGMVETLLADPLVVIDMIGQTATARRSPAPERVSDAEWRRFVRGKGFDLLAELVQGAVPSDFGRGAAVAFMPVGIHSVDAIVEPIQIDGETVGGLVVFPRGKARDELDRLAAQEAKLALSVQLLRGHVQFRSRADSLADLLGELCRGTTRDAAELLARAQRLGIELSKPARLIALGSAAAAGEAPPASLQRALLRLAARSWPGAAVAAHGGDLLVFLPDAQGGDSRRAELLARRIVDEIAWAGDKPAVTLSPLCHGISEYPRAWAECARALALARSFERTGLLAPGAFGPFADLLASMDSGSMREFVARTLGMVERYDARHRAELVRTARAFIESGCRYQACAQGLGIHVSTLRYRLGRLRERFGADLEDAETRFAFALALKLRDAMALR
jgi:purine catabolism regulator